MDTFTITLLSACGVSLTGAIAVLWRSLESERDKNSAKDKVNIEQFYSSQKLNESFQNLLVALKDQLEDMNESFRSIAKRRR